MNYMKIELYKSISQPDFSIIWGDSSIEKNNMGFRCQPDFGSNSSTSLTTFVWIKDCSLLTAWLMGFQADPKEKTRAAWNLSPSHPGNLQLSQMKQRKLFEQHRELFQCRREHSDLGLGHGCSSRLWHLPCHHWETVTGSLVCCLGEDSESGADPRWLSEVIN